MRFFSAITVLALIACNTQPVAAPGDIIVNVPPDAPDNIVVEAPIVNEGDVNVNNSDSGALCQFEMEYYLGGTRVLPTRPLVSLHASSAPYGVFDGEVYTIAIEAPAGCGDLTIGGLSSFVTTTGDEGWFQDMVDHSAWISVVVANDYVANFTYGAEGEHQVVTGSDMFINYQTNEGFTVPDGQVALLTLHFDEFAVGEGPEPFTAEPGFGQMFRAEVGPQIAFSWGEGDDKEFFIGDISSEPPIVGHSHWRQE
jgi:hypothetical protein